MAASFETLKASFVSAPILGFPYCQGLKARSFATPFGSFQQKRLGFGVTNEPVG